VLANAVLVEKAIAAIKHMRLRVFIIIFLILVDEEPKT
jgi:hypothetical protein